MTQVEKNVAYVATLVISVLLNVTPTRDYIVELAVIFGAIVWFGLIVLWNLIMSVDIRIITGVIMGLLFTAAVVVNERETRPRRWTRR